MMMDSNNIIINKLFKYCNFLIGFIFLSGIGNQLGAGFFMDYTENSELMQLQIGSNISLQCILKGLVNNTTANDIAYYWYFKQCGECSGGVLNCYDTNESDDWTQVPCQDNICKSELHLKNITEKYSGLYKCTVMPKIGNVLHVKLVRTFQLDIKDSSLKVPEFLDAYPINKTVSKGNQAEFQCLIYSEEYPTVKWFRHLSNSKHSNYENTHTVVYYNGQAYELLTSAREKPTSKNLYLSKLIINDVHLQDEGYYACVAISFHGHNIREAYLKIHEPDDDEDLTEYWSDYSEEEVILPTDHKELWLLFLMPVGLALLPLLVWLCYAAHRRYRNCSLNDETKYLKENDQQCMLEA